MRYVRSGAANPSNMGPSPGLDDTTSPPYLERTPLSTAASGSYDDASKPTIPSEPPPAALGVPPSTVSPKPSRAFNFCTRKLAEVLGLWQVGGGLMLDTSYKRGEPAAHGIATAVNKF